MEPAHTHLPTISNFLFKRRKGFEICVVSTFPDIKHGVWTHVKAGGLWHRFKDYMYDIRMTQAHRCRVFEIKELILGEHRSCHQLWEGAHLENSFCAHANHGGHSGLMYELLELMKEQIREENRWTLTHGLHFNTVEFWHLYTVTISNTEMEDQNERLQAAPRTTHLPWELQRTWTKLLCLGHSHLDMCGNNLESRIRMNQCCITDRK